MESYKSHNYEQNLTQSVNKKQYILKYQWDCFI